MYRKPCPTLFIVEKRRKVFDTLFQKLKLNTFITWLHPGALFFYTKHSKLLVTEQCCPTSPVVYTQICNYLQGVYSHCCCVNLEVYDGTYSSYFQNPLLFSSAQYALQLHGNLLLVRMKWRSVSNSSSCRFIAPIVYSLPNIFCTSVHNFVLYT